jgi:hypothetical protein
MQLVREKKRSKFGTSLRVASPFINFKYGIIGTI